MSHNKAPHPVCKIRMKLNGSMAAQDRSYMLCSVFRHVFYVVFWRITPVCTGLAACITDLAACNTGLAGLGCITHECMIC